MTSAEVLSIKIEPLTEEEILAEVGFFYDSNPDVFDISWRIADAQCEKLRQTLTQLISAQARQEQRQG